MMQQFFPAYTELNQARILLVQLTFLCAAACVSTPTMLALSFITGLLWDANSTLAPIVADSTVYPDPVDRLKFGYSIVLFAGMGYLMQGLGPLFRQGKWQLSALLTGIAMFLYLSIEYILISFFAGEFIISKSLIRFIVYTSLLNMIASPIIFAMLFYLGRIFSYSIYPEARNSHRRGNFN